MSIQTRKKNHKTLPGAVRGTEGGTTAGPGAVRRTEGSSVTGAAANTVGRIVTGYGVGTVGSLLTPDMHRFLNNINLIRNLIPKKN